MLDRRRIAEHRAMEVVRAYEEGVRGAAVTDVSAGDVVASVLIRDLLAAHGCDLPRRTSADLVSRVPDGRPRVIEVKGRGGLGPRSVIERELETLRAAGDLGWLYAVGNVTQPFPAELIIIVQDPARLPWVLTQEAERPVGSFRGATHEAVFQVSQDVIRENGEVVDLSDLSLASWAGASRD